MTGSSTIEIEGVGEVLLERSKRSKYLNIFVAPFKRVRVAIPYGISFDDAEKMVRSKIVWIKKHLLRMKKVEEQYDPTFDLLGEAGLIPVKERIHGRIKYLAEFYGFSYNKVTIRNQTTRWGSCSHKNNISLNMKLVMLSKELLDYVILHELMHTRIKNHKKEFWLELDKIVGNDKKIDKKLKNYYPELM